MSDEYERLKQLLRQADGFVMTPAQQRAQAISFAYGNLAVMSKYNGATPEKLESLRQMCANAYDKLHPDCGNE